jgi:hypothetical protein
VQRHAAGAQRLEFVLSTLRRPCGHGSAPFPSVVYQVTMAGLRYLKTEVVA